MITPYLAWTIAQSGINGVIVSIAEDSYAPRIDRVEVLIPRSNEQASKLFARLKVSEP